MTSDTTDSATRLYFRENNYLGLPPDDVRFFQQQMMPALDQKLKLVLVSKDAILLSPNGHGGCLQALAECGMLDDMERRGIKEISYFQVDNALAPALDPIFIGYHHKAGAQMSSKALWKRDPDEAMGAFVQMDGALVVKEYSELSADEARQRTEDGKLLYGLGSIAIHMMQVAFVRAETLHGFRLPFHIAEKSSATLDGNGQVITPAGKNIYKFETFVFDALRDAQRSMILEVRREEEFAPVKNAAGADSPDSCRDAMSRLFASWLGSAGIEVPRNESGCPVFPIEISPLYALDREEFVAKAPRNLNVNAPLYLGPEPRNA